MRGGRVREKEREKERRRKESFVVMKKSRKKNNSSVRGKGKEKKKKMVKYAQLNNYINFSFFVVAIYKHTCLYFFVVEIYIHFELKSEINFFLIRILCYFGCIKLLEGGKEGVRIIKNNFYFNDRLEFII